MNEMSKIFDQDLQNICTQLFRPKVKENKTLTKKDYDRKHLSTSYTTDEWSDGGKKACFDWSEVSMKLESYCAPFPGWQFFAYVRVSG